jgi:hypothetical protein
MGAGIIEFRDTSKQHIQKDAQKDGYAVTAWAGRRLLGTQIGVLAIEFVVLER